jgi:hypothetical protein
VLLKVSFFMFSFIELLAESHNYFCVGVYDVT